MKVYQELVDFIAAGSNPAQLVAFDASEEVKERASWLIMQEKTASLNADEKRELDHFLLLEHLLRLAKARARHFLEVYTQAVHGNSN